MSMSFRINKIEQEALRKKAIEINKKLVDNGKSPLKDSELVHEILLKAIKISTLDRDFNVTLAISEKN